MTTTTQHLVFTESPNTSHDLRRTIETYSAERVPVELFLRIEVRIDPSKWHDTADRLGGYTVDGLYIRARSIVRDVASTYPITNFLISTRQNISNDIQDEFNALLEMDGIGVEVIQVNLEHINVDPRYEDLFQEVENVRLQRITANERPDLVRANETRLNTTLFIQRQAQRNEQLQQARALTTQAQINQGRDLTTANTTFQAALIAAESDRNVQLITEGTILQRIIASRSREVAEIERVALANFTVAGTERQNMEVQALGNISRAYAEAQRDVTTALIYQTQRIEELTTREINATLEELTIAIDAQLEHDLILANGSAYANETLVAMRTDALERSVIKNTLGYDATKMATYTLYEALRHTGTNLTTVLNNPAQPLRLIEGNGPTSIVPALE